MMKLRIHLTVFVILGSFVFVNAQNNRKFKYPKTAFGIELMGSNYSFVQQNNYASDYNDDGLNFVFRGLYEYNPLQWVGIATGFGIDLRRYNERGSNNSLHGIVGLQIPLLVQLRAGRVFSLEGGGDINFLVYNNREREVNDGKPYPVDLVAYSGIRLRLYKGLSVGGGIRWGLTPLYEDYKPLGYTGYTKVTGTHRSINISLRYMFY